MIYKKLGVLVLIIIFFFFFSIIDCKIITKNEVLNINPEDYSYKMENQCPDISNGDFNYFNRCGFEFFCKDDNTCSQVIRRNNTAFVEFPDENGNNKSYIADICETGKCQNLTKCQSNSECLSNKCVNNHCVRNDEIKIEKCEDVYKSQAIIVYFRAYYDMRCGIPDGYQCKNNFECTSNKCSNENICQFQGLDNRLTSTSVTLINIGLILLVVIIVGSIISLYIIHHRRRKNQENVENRIEKC
ncbi:hypothetical protein PIROE2DRAFT_61266 [Piromyces sp. E2]|nr:hypothetical protein PIROE2DRAFT_61266 [Piromyces sp. E2]|eukprot:OUM63442.1 hypothetical protein PIROE2DRAFT_61266 [Piromyces sp. E2]